RPGRRLEAGGSPEIGELVRSFNEMLEGLEKERRESGRLALAAQEGERKRIAGELHDEVGQSLTGVLLMLEQLAPEVPERRRDVFVEAQEATRKSIDEVRRIAQELRPELLEHLGLVSALKALATRFTDQAGLALEWDFAPALPPLAPDAELALYRVVQESLTNVARHAAASRVWLSLQPGRDSVVLRVVDDGRGMNGRALNGGGGRGTGQTGPRPQGGGMARVAGARSPRGCAGGDQPAPPGRRRGAGGGPRRDALMPIPLVARILVADDHAIVRRGLKLVMEREPD